MRARVAQLTPQNPAKSDPPRPENAENVACRRTRVSVVDITDNAAELGRSVPRRLPRRRPVPGVPGIYYRPRHDGQILAPYEFSFRDLTGHRRWQVVHGDLAIALEQQAGLRMRRRPATQPAVSASFEVFARGWLSRRQVRPRTLDRYRWAIENHLLPRLGQHQLAAIDAELVARLVMELRRNDLSEWSVKTVLQPLKMILADAVRKGLLRSNPCDGLDRHERPRNVLRRPRRILSLDEMRAVLEASGEPRYRCLIELLITGGLRIGEALGLTAGDIDGEHSLIHIRQQLSREKTQAALKTTASARVIDLPPQLITEMLTLSGNAASKARPTRWSSQAETAPASNERSAAQRSTAPAPPPASAHPGRRCTSCATVTPPC